MIQCQNYILSFKINILINTMIQKLGYKFKSIILKIKGYDYEKLYNEISDEDYDDHEEEYVDFSDMPSLGSGEKEVKDGKGLKILT